jgi:hypothetical protein
MEMSVAGYLTAAEVQYGVGNHREAAGLMWDAAQATFMSLGRARGLECADLIELAKSLESDGSVPKYYFRGGLVGATLLRDHAELEVLEQFELKDAYEATRQFVRDCLDDGRHT